MVNTSEASTQTGGARLKKQRRWPLIAILSFILLLAGAYLGLCAFAIHSPTIWNGTYVLGQDLGGLTMAEAVQAVQRPLPDLEIGLYLHHTDTPDPSSEEPAAPDAVIPLESLHAKVDVPALIQGAVDARLRTTPFLLSGWRYLTNFQRVYYGAHPGDIQVDPLSAAVAAQSVSRQLSWEAQDTSYEAQDDLLLVHMALDGRHVSTQDIQQQLEDGLWTADLSLHIPYTTSSAQPLSAQEIYNQVAGGVQNATYDAATNSILPERVGADFHVDSAQAAMDNAQPGDTVSIPAQIEYPAVTAEVLQAVLFRDVLGECRTHVSGSAARISNVKLSASACNNVILNSGDVFSYNTTVGERTAAKGYKAAPAYVKGETVDEIGGGVCQPSSTLYLACLRANLEITERYAHRYVPAYIPWGMDATVSWGGPDYKFTNNTNYPIKIVTSYANGYLTIQILGTNESGSTVKMTNETLSTTSWETVYEEDPTLPAGTEKVKTSPYTGHKVRTYRNVYDANGNLISSTYEATSDYKVRNKVILRGPALPEADLNTPAAGSGNTPAEPGVPAAGDLPEIPALPEISEILPDIPLPVIPDLPTQE